MNSSSLNSEGRGSHLHPAAQPTLLLQGATIPAARTPGWLIGHQPAIQSTELTRTELNTYARLQTVVVQEPMHSCFEVFAAGAARAVAISSATACKSSLFSSFKHPLTGLTARYLGTTTELMLRQQAFRKGKAKS